MGDGWQPVLSDLTSDTCLTSQTFAASNVPNGTAYCVYRVPSLHHAQICCLSEVIQDPQDECTYVCLHQTSFPILSCLHTVLGSLDLRDGRPGQQTFSTPLSGKAVQMLCFDNEGTVLPNITYPAHNMSTDGRPPPPPHSPIWYANGSQEESQSQPPSRPNFENSLQGANPATSSATTRCNISYSLRSWSILVVPLTIVSIQILSYG